MRANLPDFRHFLGKALPTRPDVVIQEHIASGNDGHLFRAHSDSLRRDLACKIIPRSNLAHGPQGQEIWQAEVHKADALRNPTVVKFEDVRKWKEGAVDCIALISEFVEGPSLKQFTKDFSGEVTVPFIVDWLRTMLNLFNEMKMRNLSHGDLHMGNILVEDRSSYDLIGPRFVFRVTDFGVADATSEPRFKDDYLQLADMLAQLLRSVGFPACSPKDKFIFNILRHHFLDRHLAETDVTRDPIARQPGELVKKLKELDQDYESATATEITRLVTPFDFLSCEQVGQAPALLRALYSDRFLGLAEIESQNNVVVTGPRGCGKTTVFRSLSLEQKIHVGEASPDKSSYLGIYYRCDDLYFAFPRYKLPDRDDALDIPIHFVTVSLLAKLLESLETWARQYFSDAFAQAEATAAEGLWKSIGMEVAGTPNMQTLKALVAKLYKERVRAAEWQRFVNDPGRNPGRCVGPEVLQKACEVLVKNFTFLQNRPIYFFIDDYSLPKVSKALQLNLNRVFMQRTPVCFFKLSTESPVSFAKEDIDGKIYVESREFVMQNLGLVYLHAEVETKLIFIEDVFRRRLSTTTNFPARNLVELVGKNPNQNNNELARQIRAGEKPALWGKQILCRLCSGDIHYLIGLVGNMVRASGGPTEIAKKAGECKISQEVQNRAIREEAGGFLKNLRGIPQNGEQLVAIVEAFGSVAYSQLRFLNSKNEDSSPPKQATRIEPYEAFTLSEKAQKLYDELLRYSVFIEDFRGKSRRGNIVPRLFLRRFLIPHFNLTFSTRDSIELEATEFENFLLEPKKFEQKLRLKSAEEAGKYEVEVETQQQQLSLRLQDPAS